MNHHLPIPYFVASFNVQTVLLSSSFIFLLKFILALYRFYSPGRIPWRGECQMEIKTWHIFLQIKFFLLKPWTFFYLTTTIAQTHHMTRRDTSIDSFFPRSLSKCTFFPPFVEWPASDLKLLIITIITHIVQQSFSLWLFSDTTTAGVNDLQAVWKKKN